MAPRPDYTAINKFLHSWSSCEIDLAGKTVRGFKALNFAEELGQEPEYANSPFAIGKVITQYKPTLDFEQAIAEFDHFIGLLGANYMTVPFNLGAQWQEVGGTNLRTFEAHGLTIMKISHSSGGAATMKVECCITAPFVRDGKTALERFGFGSAVGGIIGGAIGGAAGAVVGGAISAIL